MAMTDPSSRARHEASAKSAATSGKADWQRLLAAYPELLQGLAERAARGDQFTLPDPFTVAGAYATVARQMLLHPERLAEAQARLLQHGASLWQYTLARMLGVEAEPPARPDAKDRRFQADSWSENPCFDALRQGYLLMTEELLAATRDVTADLPAHERAQAEFYTRQLLEALSPSNHAASNPQVLHEALRTGGSSLLRGAANLLEDTARGKGQPRIRQADRSAFELGRDIAATPGQVVYQNPLFQLIQYSPTTEEVARRPLLIVPPWINKYYVLDLVPKRSFVRWAVARGLTVFVISWVNPDERYAEVGFEDYLTGGVLEAMDAVGGATGERELNAMGYCIGGTLLSCTLAYLAARGDDRVASATFLTSLMDFSDVGELSVFIDEAQIRDMERHMASLGYFEGTHLATAFNLLQARELIWGCGVNNYLLGREPPAFDLLYWNSDSTRMPRRMHSFYLRNMYLENRLRGPGGITLAGLPIDLGRVRLPTFVLAAQRDHIAPWRSCYRSAKLLGGRRVRFVLGESGHIAGVMNPAGSGKYGYWTHRRLPPQPDDWLADAEHRQGSWWPEWHTWLQRFSGGPVPARKPGDGRLAPIEPAPGSYVRVQVDEPACRAPVHQGAGKAGP